MPCHFNPTGRNKLACILGPGGKLTRSEIEEQYHIGRRSESAHQTYHTDGAKHL
jgi:hypothetical protein